MIRLFTVSLVIALISTSGCKRQQNDTPKLPVVANPQKQQNDTPKPAVIADPQVQQNDLPKPTVIDRPQAQQKALPKPPEPFTNSMGIKFVWIPAGSFLMGSPKVVGQGWLAETQHKVTLTKGFYMGIYTVTQEEWQAVMGTNRFLLHQGKNLPVDSVSWNDCQQFITTLRQKDDIPYRLPTEAEWEYACRAGTTTAFHFGETISIEQANYGDGKVFVGSVPKSVYKRQTTPVSSYPANAFGLHDMHGNVYQWCQDWVGDYPKEDVIDPQGPDVGQQRILRGGSYLHSPQYGRSASRNWNQPNTAIYGFRICFFVE